MFSELRKNFERDLREAKKRGVPEFDLKVAETWRDKALYFLRFSKDKNLDKLSREVNENMARTNLVFAMEFISYCLNPKLLKPQKDG